MVLFFDGIVLHSVLPGKVYVYVVCLSRLYTMYEHITAPHNSMYITLHKRIVYCVFSEKWKVTPLKHNTRTCTVVGVKHPQVYGLLRVACF